MNRLLVLLMAAPALAACTVPVATMERPDAYYDKYDGAVVASETESLFAGDAETLSDDAIRTILEHRYEPPRLSRIALMPLDREVWSTWSEELALASEDIRRDVVGRLRQSPRVYDASYLPPILVPEDRTVPRLREAAARYQADLLLVYRTDCRSFDRSRLFRPPVVRAYCVVEAVLLDTRTGLVPFTTVATHAYDIARNEGDTNFQETRFRARADAKAVALGEISDEIVRFLTKDD